MLETGAALNHPPPGWGQPGRASLARDHPTTSCPPDLVTSHPHFCHSGKGQEGLSSFLNFVLLQTSLKFELSPERKAVTLNLPPTALCSRFMPVIVLMPRRLENHEVKQGRSYQLHNLELGISFPSASGFSGLSPLKQSCLRPQISTKMAA